MKDWEDFDLPENKVIDSIENRVYEKTASRNGIPRFVYFDLETLRTIDQVGGWSNTADMGVSVLCEYDTIDGWENYAEDDLDAFIDKLNKADLVIGFNHESFDYEVLSGLGYARKLLDDLPSLDLMTSLEKPLGRKVSLEDLAKMNLFADKLENGKFAPEMWQDGEKDRVIRYCFSDVQLTRGLHMFGAYNGHLMLPYDMCTSNNSIVKVNWPLAQ